VDSGGHKEPCRPITWGSEPPWDGTILREKGRPIVKYRDTLRSAVQKRLNRSRCRLGCEMDGPKESCVRWKSRGAEDIAMTTNFGTKIAITGFVRTTETRQLVMRGFAWSADRMQILPIPCT